MRSQSAVEEGSDTTSAPERSWRQVVVALWQPPKSRATNHWRSATCVGGRPLTVTDVPIGPIYGESWGCLGQIPDQRRRLSPRRAASAPRCRRGARDLRGITQADALAFTEYVTAKQSRRTGRPTTVATAETALSILRPVLSSSSCTQAHGAVRQSVFGGRTSTSNVAWCTCDVRARGREVTPKSGRARELPIDAAGPTSARCSSGSRSRGWLARMRTNPRTTSSPRSSRSRASSHRGRERRDDPQSLPNPPQRLRKSGARDGI